MNKNVNFKGNTFQIATKFKLVNRAKNSFKNLSGVVKVLSVLEVLNIDVVEIIVETILKAKFHSEAQEEIIGAKINSNIGT